MCTLNTTVLENSGLFPMEKWDSVTKFTVFT